MRALLDSLRKSLTVALATAGAFVAWTGALRLFAGTGPFERHGVSFTQVALSYVVGGALSAVVAGLLIPLVKPGPAGGALIGGLAALPFAAVMVYVRSGELPGRYRDADGFASSAFLAVVLLGLVAGARLPGAVQRARARLGAREDGPPSA